MIPDLELRQLFRELELEDEASAPAFRELRERAPMPDLGRSPNRSAWLAGSLAVTVLVVAFLFLSPPPTTPPAQETAIASLSLPRWSAPTDFLLETPGKTLLESTPAIGIGLPEIPAAQLSRETKGTRR